MANENSPDDLLHGARNIAIAAGFVDADGEPNLRKTYYALEKGYLPATKLGPRLWVSTRGRILRSLGCEPGGAR